MSWQRPVRGAAIAALLAVSVLVLLRVVAGAWTLDGGALPNSRGDFLYHAAQIKTVLELGWYPLTNPLMGAPWGSEPYDFPGADALSILAIRLLGLFSGDWLAVAKAYFVLGFVLVAWVAYGLMRELGLDRGPAFGGALAFAFLPYHFLRISHLFLAFYVAVPLAAWASLVTRDARLLQPVAGSARWRLVLALLACLAVGSGGAYYAFFGALFIACSGVYFAAAARDWRPLANAAALVTVVVVSLGVNLVPTWRYQAAHGPNRIALPQRDLAATESNSVKLTQLLLPSSLHRVGPLAALEHRYAAGAPLIAENRASSLGLVGAIGLALLGLHGLLRLARGGAGPPPMLSWLALLAAVALLVASVGGINSLFVMLVSPMIRGWNRISVFIGLFSIAATMICLQHLLRAITDRRPGLSSALAELFLPVAIGAFAAWEQTPVQDIVAVRALAAQEQKFFSLVQARMPAGGLVFQLPYQTFPEAGNTPRWSDYSHMRGYLHTRSIGWSYGSMKGRAGDLWYRMASLQPPAPLIAYLESHGFSGLYVDRVGYADDAKALIAEVQGLLGPPAVTSQDGKLLFFTLRPTGAPRAGFDGLAGSRAVAELPIARGTCNMDMIGATAGQAEAVLTRDHPSRLAGWVGDPATGSPPGDAHVYLLGRQGILAIPAHVGVRRDDVAAVMRAGNLADSGFIALIRPGDVPTGDYGVAIGFADAAGKATCRTGYRIKVE